MSVVSAFGTRIESLEELLLEISQVRSCDALLECIVRRLAERPQVALARIWLIAPGDLCRSCRFRESCPDRTRCLHLEASAGRSVVDPDIDWSQTNDGFRRMPIGGTQKVGHIAATAAPVEVPDLAQDMTWIAHPEWVHAEGIRGFGGQPLVHGQETLGVLAVFTRIPLSHDALVWLRVLADHAAASIANARAFQEIERLRRQLELEKAYLLEEVQEARAFGNIVGRSPALATVLRQIELVAPTDATVLVTGESGTGKELVAREIHRRSKRAERPLIRVNCATIPRQLYESEFFGHVEGAFTGALRDRVGRFEAADGGTLFLDEVGEIPLGLQSKLLRVLQEREFERVGDAKTREADVRIVAATNRDLKDDVRAGRFREDLYYRLNVFPIHVSPLRERAEDIPLLVSHFLEHLAQKLHLPRRTPSRANIRDLQAYPWPGNVRELQNVLERAMIASPGTRLHLDLPAAGSLAAAADPQTPTRSRRILTDGELRRLERDNLIAALDRTGWKVSGDGGAAELLGVRPTTLTSRIKKLGLERP